MANFKYLVIFPDIHGRSFWKETYNLYKDDPEYGFIFLGDYLDPYGDEGITKNMAIDNFVDILETTKDNENVIMLVGNHDWHYKQEFKRQWGCRRDDWNFDKISNLFGDNIKRFKIAFEIKGKKGTKFLFTHAGVTNEWIKYCGKHIDEHVFTPEIMFTAYGLNSLFNDKKLYDSLWVCGSMRGGRANAGSPLWCDLSEFEWENDSRDNSKNIYQIFSHTRSWEPVIDGEYKYAMLDAQKPFILDLENETLLQY